MGRPDFYSEALAAASKVLELTKGLLLTGEPEKAENEIKRFVTLVEQREPFIQKIIQLRKQALASSQNADTGKNEERWKDVLKVIDEIAAENEKKMALIAKIKTSVASNLKTARDNVKLNNVYTIPQTGHVGGLLDIKN